MHFAFMFNITHTFDFHLMVNKFFGHPAYEIIGIILIVIATVILFVGIRRYRIIKKLIGAIDPEDWQALEAMVEKDRKSKG